jgi:hypothetical protein
MKTTVVAQREAAGQVSLIIFVSAANLMVGKNPTILRVGAMAAPGQGGKTPRLVSVCVLPGFHTPTR